MVGGRAGAVGVVGVEVGGRMGAVGGPAGVVGGREGVGGRADRSRQEKTSQGPRSLRTWKSQSSCHWGKQRSGFT